MEGAAEELVCVKTHLNFCFLLWIAEVCFITYSSCAQRFLAVDAAHEGTFVWKGVITASLGKREKDDLNGVRCHILGLDTSESPKTGSPSAAW